MNDQQTEPTGPGHNSVGCDQPTFHRHIALIGNKRATLKVAREQHKKARQAAKADGILLKDLDRALELADMTGEEQRQYLNTQAAYLQWLKVPLGSQMSMFEAPDFMGDEEAIKAEADELAAGKGFFAGLNGVDESDNPHEANNPTGQAWIKGYREGEDQRRQAMAMGDG